MDESKRPAHETRAAAQEQEQLEKLWMRLDTGTATPQDRIDALTLAGRLKDQSSAPRVWRLTCDDDELVRYFAIQTLVLDLDVKTADAAELCWRLLDGDPDEDVQGMAATCLGNIFFGSGMFDVFERLKRLLRSTSLPGFVKGSIYRALFSVAGWPPSKWPGLTGPRKVFEETDIDWQKIDQLERSVRGVGG